MTERLNWRKRITASKDKTIIIWTIENYEAKFYRKVDLGRPVCYLSWSPNDQMLLATGELLAIYEFNSASQLRCPIRE